jgi:hypothetical protein
MSGGTRAIAAIFLLLIAGCLAGCAGATKELKPAGDNATATPGIASPSGDVKILYQFLGFELAGPSFFLPDPTRTFTLQKGPAVINCTIYMNYREMDKESPTFSLYSARALPQGGYSYDLESATTEIITVHLVNVDDPSIDWEILTAKKQNFVLMPDYTAEWKYRYDPYVYKRLDIPKTGNYTFKYQPASGYLMVNLTQLLLKTTYMDNKTHNGYTTVDVLDFNSTCPIGTIPHTQQLV